LLAAAILTAVTGSLAGCGPEGAGTIKIDPDVRAKVDGNAANSGKKVSAKQAQGKAIAEEAVKKHPKLQ